MYHLWRSRIRSGNWGTGVLTPQSRFLILESVCIPCHTRRTGVKYDQCYQSGKSESFSYQTTVLLATCYCPSLSTAANDTFFPTVVELAENQSFFRKYGKPSENVSQKTGTFSIISHQELNHQKVNSECCKTPGKLTQNFAQHKES